MKKNIKNLILALFVLGIVFVAPAVSAQTYYTNNGTTMNTQQTSQMYYSGTSSVDLNASVNPGGQTTTGWFEYGTDANFYAFNETEHIFIGAGNTDMPVAVTINNLMPNTVYYFRVVTNNGRSTVKGNILTFVTTQNQNTQNTQSTLSTTNNTNYVNRYVNTTTPVTYSNSTAAVANPLFGTAFLPSNVFDWLILLILIFAIVWVIRRLSQPTAYVITK